MAESQQLYEFKKALKRLNEFRGSGTELISVYIPSGSPIHEMANRLREEMSQASNIKSKSTRTNVIGALERILQHFKMYKQTPPNGLSVFCGNISDNPSKTDIDLFAVEPPFKLGIGTYRCDSRFFLEPLQKMIENTDTYGIVVLDGREATLAILRGTQVDTLKKITSMAHAKIKVGGQCLAAGTLVIKGDGEITEIENLKPEQDVIGLDFRSSKTTPAKASDFFVTKAKHSFIIKTKWPLSEIHATHYHRFFVISEHGIKEKFAKDLNENDRVLIAKTINCITKKVKTGFVAKKKISLNRNERRKLRNARLRLGLSQKKAAEIIGLSQMVISYVENGTQGQTNEHIRSIYQLYDLVLDEKALSKDILYFPEYWNVDLARLCGIICGDGTSDGDRIVIYEGHKELVEDYCKLIERAIKIKPVVRVTDKTKQKGSFAKKKYYEIRIYSRGLANAILQITPSILLKDRDIPKDMPKCENKIIGAFLSGLYDAEGYLHGDRVDIAMTSKKLIQKVHLLLLRFGILSSFAEKKVRGNKQWFVSISDKEAVRKFRDIIGFNRSDKKRKLNNICNKKTVQQYADQIPIDGREVFRLATENGLKTSDFYAASNFFRNKKPLGREAFARNILSVFRKHKKTKKGKEIFEYLSSLYKSDFTVASVKEKEYVQSEEEFYDLTIPVHSNFVANGVIVHNSARRYQRLIEESIEYYYKKVGDAMDEFFVGKTKGVIVGGPGPTKEFFMKMSPFNYQIKVLGVVDTGYTDEYGVTEVLTKSTDILSEQETVKEKKLIENFIREIVNDRLATYGEKQVRDAIENNQADKVLISEGLEYKKASYVCSACGSKADKLTKEKVQDRIPCKCGSEMKLEKETELLEELVELARAHNIEVEIISTNTSEGLQLLNGFGGIGAFLRYRTR